MSKPKFQWLESEPGARNHYATYGEIKLVIDEERKPTADVPGKYRLRCLTPKKMQLSKPVTFPNLSAAKKAGESEARRIHKNLPPVDHALIHSVTEKAKIHDSLVAQLAAHGHSLIEAVKEFGQLISILAGIGLAPLEAAYEAVKLRKMTDGRAPEELIGKYLDEFERVQNHELISTIVNKRVEQIKQEKLSEAEKRGRINQLREFANERDGRLFESVTIEELKAWYLGLHSGGKRRYDKWLILRDLVEVAYKDYRSITKWVYDCMMELNYCVRSGTLNGVMPLPVYRALFDRCHYRNDALYLAIMSDVPIRDAELKRLRWEMITWVGDVPRYFNVPPDVAQKNGTDRYVRIPFRLRPFLVAFRQPSGLIIVGRGHLERLKALAREIDPLFDWNHNTLRRTCISNHVAVFQNRDFMAKQSDHEVKVMRRCYERPVNPIEARQYVRHQPDLARLQALPLEPPKNPNGRPRKPKPDPLAKDVFVAIVAESAEPVAPAEPTSAPAASSPSASEPTNPSTQGEPPNNGSVSKAAEALVGPTPPLNSGKVEKPGKGTRPHMRVVDLKPILQPPRKPNGNIDWDQIPLERRYELLRDHPATHIAEAWGVSVNAILNKAPNRERIGARWSKVAAQQRQAERAATATAEEAVVAKPVPWAVKSIFLRLLWEMTAKDIAARYHCDRTIIYKHADRLKLDRPGPGHWLKKHPQTPPEILERIAELEAEEDAAAAATSTPPPVQTPLPPTPPVTPHVRWTEEEEDRNKLL